MRLSITVWQMPANEGCAPWGAETSAVFQTQSQTEVWLCRFLCALQPHDRKKWAQRYTQLIKPGGQLATLIFPVDASKDRNEGPPFPVTPELYADLLETT